MGRMDLDKATLVLISAFAKDVLQLAETAERKANEIEALKAKIHAMEREAARKKR